MLFAIIFGREIPPGQLPNGINNFRMDFSLPCGSPEAWTESRL